MAKDKIAEAQDAIKEKNTLVLQKAAMAKEMEEMKRSRAEEVAAARVEAIESFQGSEEMRSYIMDQMVAMQMRWEDRVARFNPSVRINFDTSGEPPSPRFLLAKETLRMAQSTTLKARGLTRES
ncbi:unnamed protein product [Prunus brigantina]